MGSRGIPGWGHRCVASAAPAGRGAFGRVYKAVHPREGWLMAVKEVDAQHFEAEMDLLAALDAVWAMKVS